MSRHTTLIRRAVVLSCAVLVVISASRSAAAPPPDHPPRPIVVRVYEVSDVPFEMERALAESQRLLRAAQVDVRWRRCIGAVPAAACRMPPESAELILRITPARRLPRPHGHPLGEALLSRCEGGGVLATVYADRVVALAREADVDVAMLIGRVTAHELGHLLEHTSAHARTGLMRANWTPEEVRRDRPPDWIFTPEDVAAMRR